MRLLASRKIVRSLLIIIICLAAAWRSPAIDKPAVNLTASQSAVVTKIIDGDTIELNNGQRVRYIGVDTSEISRTKNQASECLAEEAKSANRQLVFQKKVRLEKDVSETDKYGRLLRYVYVKNQADKEIMVNQYLVEQGLATLATYPPDVKYVSLFRAGQTKARTASKGLWSKCMLK
jgi:micrococcal nuclease